ncbi:hypothetical protein OG921_14145 [Aldersonia sp. NBC_00410]|uniref:hypothetical protein n=1 Tax=Aldersonia sp. NBC_00410 TaxID=2975954 RepID=UPI002250AE63|nr:hypothetical protein [Aldersonia sp. NBC_00410]MCX5044309.1 hypothetical protein [Aldersonia sp. NBC_00410]
MQRIVVLVMKFQKPPSPADVVPPVESDPAGDQSNTITDEAGSAQPTESYSEETKIHG